MCRRRRSPPSAPPPGTPLQAYATRFSPFEPEAARLCEARQRGDPGIGDRQKTERSADLLADDQPADPAFGERRPEPAAIGELRDDRVRDELDRAVDQDEIVGRAGLVAGLERSFDCLDLELAGALGEFGCAFQGERLA